MATSITSIYLNINELLITQSFLPDDVIISKPASGTATGTVVQTNAAPVYPVGTTVTYMTSDSDVQITIDGTVYRIINQSAVIFGMQAAS